MNHTPTWVWFKNTSYAEWRRLYPHCVIHVHEVLEKPRPTDAGKKREPGSSLGLEQRLFKGMWGNAVGLRNAPHSVRGSHYTSAHTCQHLPHGTSMPFMGHELHLGRNKQKKMYKTWTLVSGRQAEVFRSSVPSDSSDLLWNASKIRQIRVRKKGTHGKVHRPAKVCKRNRNQKAVSSVTGGAPKETQRSEQAQAACLWRRSFPALTSESGQVHIPPPPPKKSKYKYLKSSKRWRKPKMKYRQ